MTKPRWEYHRSGSYSIEIPDYGHLHLHRPNEASIDASITTFRERLLSTVYMEYDIDSGKLSVSISDKVVGEKQDIVHVKEALKQARAVSGLSHKGMRRLDLLLMKMEKQ